MPAPVEKRAGECSRAIGLAAVALVVGLAACNLGQEPRRPISQRDHGDRSLLVQRDLGV